MARMVMVADDSPTIQKRASAILKDEGFDVETVSNGVAAIKRLAAVRPMIILADVSMPGRDGYEVCEFVKKSLDFSHVPVLLVASDMEPYDDVRGARVRADGIVKKPFEPHELISVVTRFVERFEAEASKIAAYPLTPTPPRPIAEFVIPTEARGEMPAGLEQATREFAGFGEEAEFAQHAEEQTAETSGTPAARVGMQLSPAQPETRSALDSTPLHEFGEAYPSPEAHEPPQTVIPLSTHQATAETSLESAPAAFADTFPGQGPHETPVDEIPLLAEEPPAPVSFEEPSVHAEEQTPSYLERLEAATPEPVYIEEPAPEAVEPPETPPQSRTRIFRTPLEIAEPVWKDETVPAPPVPEPAVPLPHEPEFEGLTVSRETPPEPALEDSHIALAATTPDLESLALDEAAASQALLASEAAEAGAPEVVAAREATSEVTEEQTASPEVAQVETPEIEGATAEAPAEGAPRGFAPAEPAQVETPEAPAAEAWIVGTPEEVAPTDLTQGATAEGEAAITEAPTRILPVEYLEEEPIHVAAPPPGSAPAAIAAAETVEPSSEVEEAPSGVVVPAEPIAAWPLVGELTADTTSVSPVGPEPAAGELAPAGAIAPEAVPAEVSPQLPEGEPNPHEVVGEAKEPETAHEAAAHTPTPEIGRGLIYAIVHHVVTRMAPAPLPKEAVEELARRLTEEVVSETSEESPSSEA